MALNCVQASNSYLSRPVSRAYPFTYLLAVLPNVEDTRVALSSHDATAGDQYFNRDSGAWKLTSGATTMTFGDATMFNQWYFSVLRFIAADNIRADVLQPNGVIASTQITVANNTCFTTTLYLGAWGFAPTFISWDGGLAEFCEIDADVQPGGAATNPELVRQLAYRGPFSVPHIKKDIVEYRSFREHPTAGKKRDVYFGAKGIQTWTNTNGVTVVAHPPLIRRAFQEPTLYAGMAAPLVSSAPFTFTGAASFPFVSKAAIASPVSFQGAAVWNGIGSSGGGSGGTGSGLRGGMIANVGGLMGH